MVTHNRDSIPAISSSMEPVHYKDYVSLVKSGAPDLVLISKDGEKFFTWQLLLSFYSSSVATLLRAQESGLQDFISLPFSKEELRTFLDNFHNHVKQIEENMIANFLGISLNNQIFEDKYKMVETKEKSYKIQELKEEKLPHDILPTYNIKEPLEEIEENHKPVKLSKVPRKCKKKPKRKKASLFDCNLCENGFLKENLLKKHKLSKHNVPAICSICDVRFTDSEVFMKHMKDKSHKSLACTCETCGVTFQSKTALGKHKSWTHEETEKIPCKYCGVIVQGMEWHLKNIHENPIETCMKCDFQTRRSYSMKRHVKKVHTEVELQTCEHCGEMRKNLSKHIKRTGCGQGSNSVERKPEICDQCEKVFATMDSLKKHTRRVHLKIKNRRCDQCDYSTYSGFNLKLHISKMHTGIDLEKEECKHCLKEFYNLPYHLKIYHQGY